jgi:hypothetical protein
VFDVSLSEAQRRIHRQFIAVLYSEIRMEPRREEPSKKWTDSPLGSNGIGEELINEDHHYSACGTHGALYDERRWYRYGQAHPGPSRTTRRTTPEDGTPPENPGSPTGVGTPIVSLSGSALWGGNGQVTIDARVLPSGQVQGTQTWVDQGFLVFSGPVLEVVPPSTEVDYWCISARVTEPASEGSPPHNTNWYVRDSGDGVTTFDELGNVFGNADDVNCTFHRQVLQLTPVTEGDFQGNY